MTSRLRFLSLALLVVAVTACKDKESPTEPNPAATFSGAFEAAQGELSSLAGTLPTASHVDPSTAPQPLMARLVRISLERLTVAGREELKARAIGELRERHEAVRAAAAAGDRESFQRAKHALDVTSARLVTLVLSPRIVPEVIQMVGRQARAVSERLDAAARDGRDVAGPRRVLQRVVARLEESRRLLESGNPVGALVVAANAADLLHTAFHR